MWNKMTYVWSTHTKEKWPNHQKKEIVIVGRSNVGKSSLINALSNNSKLAKISKKPGKTRSLNFFNVGNKFMFVDVPGYGFAKVGNHQKQLFSDMIEEYLGQREQLQIAIQLLDIRRVPNEDDKMMIEFFKYNNIEILYVVTKIDKVNQSETFKGLKKISESLNLKQEELIVTSATKRKGIKKLKKIIEFKLDL